MKHFLEWLIYFLNENKSVGMNREVKSSKSILIKTGYPNLLHGCDFLCQNLMNYSWLLEGFWRQVLSDKVVQNVQLNDWLYLNYMYFVKIITIVFLKNNFAMTLAVGFIPCKASFVGHSHETQCCYSVNEIVKAVSFYLSDGLMFDKLEFKWWTLLTCFLARLVVGDHFSLVSRFYNWNERALWRDQAN